MLTTSFPIDEIMDFINGKFNGNDCSFTLVKNEENNISSSTKDILGFKPKFQNWRQKMDDISSLGYTGLDLQSVFSSRNEGQPSDFFLMSKINFSAPAVGMLCQVEFFAEMKGNCFFREVTLATFRANQRSMVEISYEWVEGVKLHAHSLNEFIKNPNVVFKQRFLQ